MADFTTKQYLDFDGLKVYDGKIKGLINAEVAARQEADNKHTADIGTNATNIQNLTKYVGTIPADATATDVIGYVQEKTTGIATDSTVNALTERVESLEENKVEKETGKGLSTNDYTTEEKNKLAGVAAGAQVNVIETVKVNGVALIPDANKAVDVAVPTGALASKDKVAEADLETALADKLNGKADQTTTYTKDEVDALVKDAKDYADNNDANETFTISYADKTITLTGSNGTNSTIDASEFVKDGMLSNVAYEEATNELVFTWNTDAGIAETKVKLTDIIDAINGSEGEEVKVTITDGNVVNAELTQTVKDSLALADTAVQPKDMSNLINNITATKTSTKFDDAKDGFQVQVVQEAGYITGVNTLGNFDHRYDAKGDAEAVYAAIESIPTTGENSIESLFA